MLLCAARVAASALAWAASTIKAQYAATARKPTIWPSASGSPGSRAEAVRAPTRISPRVIGSSNDVHGQSMPSSTATLRCSEMRAVSRT